MASTDKRRKCRENRVALGAELVISGAADLHAQLNEALPGSAPVVLDAAAVTRLDTSALQLLQAFVQARKAGAHEWRWENVGAGLRDAAAQLGLEQMLDLPAVAPAHD